MTLLSHMNYLEKSGKALLYLMLLLCLPETSVYASTSQQQAADLYPTEIVFFHLQPAKKSITYYKALAQFRDKQSSLNVYQPKFIFLLRVHERLGKIALNHISKQFFCCPILLCLHQPKVIPISTDDLPAPLSRA